MNLPKGPLCCTQWTNTRKKRVNPEGKAITSLVSIEEPVCATIKFHTKFCSILPLCYIIFLRSLTRPFSIFNYSILPKIVDLPQKFPLFHISLLTRNSELGTRNCYLVDTKLLSSPRNALIGEQFLLCLVCVCPANQKRSNSEPKAEQV